MPANGRRYLTVTSWPVTASARDSSSRQSIACTVPPIPC